MAKDAIPPTMDMLLAGSLSCRRHVGDVGDGRSKGTGGWRSDPQLEQPPVP